MRAVALRHEIDTKVIACRQFFEIAAVAKGIYAGYYPECYLVSNKDKGLLQVSNPVCC